MMRLFLGTLFGLGVVTSASACGGNGENDCRQVCNWWGNYCVDSVESCVEDCLESDESAGEAIERCVNGGGWGTPSTCQSAGCCVRFIYADYDSRCVGF